MSLGFLFCYTFAKCAPVKALPSPVETRIRGSTITVEGPLIASRDSVMYPVDQRDLFSEIYCGVCNGKSFVLHGPYQCGKTTFLWALGDKLIVEAAITCVSFDMSMAKGMMSIYGEKDGFYKYISLQTFGAALDEEGLIKRLREPSERRCLLVDEFQFIFRSNTLLDVAKDFFRNLSSYPNISYVAAGTYGLIDLMTSDGSTFLSPFNKVGFRQMPFFQFNEMGEIFELSQPGGGFFGNPDQNCSRIQWPSGFLHDFTETFQ